MQHRGEIIKIAVYKSGFPITNLAKRLNKSRRWVYLMFEKKEISLDLILQIGNIIHFDFTQEINALNALRNNKHVDYENSIYWENKYLELFKNYKSLNIFFIDKIKELINIHSNIYYKDFKDFIDKWFVSKFRPAINSFIIEINTELSRDFGVVLFIAGGDAMRRYENDISFTKDIDTKLYINNVIVSDTIRQKIEEKRRIVGASFDEKTFIKDCVVSVIVKHIVKLRNYLEQNISNIFHDILQFDERNIARGTEILNFKIDKDHTIVVDILLDEDKKLKYQQFRIRENKKRIDFPVDLYSIDFRTFIGVYDNNGNIIEGSKKIHDISILDVVLQDIDDFNESYITIVDNIPVASLKFLLEDFYKTYTTPDRALARISSEKVNKDIIRFNKIKELYLRQEPRDNGGKLIIHNINKIISDLNKHQTSFRNHTNFMIFRTFLLKILNKEPINIINFNSTIKTYNDINIQNFINIYPELKLAMLDMFFYKKNMYNENLHTILEDYSSYIEDNDKIRQGYYELFSKLCSIENPDGLLRHVIMFSNPKIIAAFNQLKQIKSKYSIGIQKKIQKPKPKPTPIPKPVKVAQVQISSRGRTVNKIDYATQQPSRKRKNSP